MIYIRDNATGLAMPLEKYHTSGKPTGKKEPNKKRLFKKFKTAPDYLLTICKWKGNKDICVDCVELKQYIDLVPCPKCKANTDQLKRIQEYKEGALDVMQPVKNLTDKAAVLCEDKNGYTGKIKCGQCGSMLSVNKLIHWMIRLNASEKLFKSKDKEVDKEDTIEEAAKVLLSTSELRKLQKEEEAKEQEDEEDPLEDELSVEDFDHLDEGDIK